MFRNGAPSSPTSKYIYVYMFEILVARTLAEKKRTKKIGLLLKFVWGSNSTQPVVAVCWQGSLKRRERKEEKENRINVKVEAGQAVEQERRKEREKKISVKVRVTRGEPRTAVAERLQRQSGRVAE